jgi:hypothetical protein
MLGDDLAVAAALIDKNSDGEESREVKHIARHAGSDVPAECVELFGKDREYAGCDHGLPRLENSAQHEHRDEVQESERHVVDHAPVDERDEDDQGASHEENVPLALSIHGQSHYVSLVSRLPNLIWRGRAETMFRGHLSMIDDAPIDRGSIDS